MNEKNMVTKANALITAKYTMSVEEQRIILTLISQVQPDDEDFKPYEFKIAKFIELLGLGTKTKYTEIPKITENLMKKIIKIKDGKTLLQVAWLSSARHDEGTGTVTLKFDPELKPYLLGLKQYFTSYKLENAIKLTSKYSFRLYEILKSNEYKKSITIELLEFAEMLALTKSYAYFDIKRQILEPAKRELAEKTDISFTYETVTERKKVIALKFHIRANLKNKPKKVLPELPAPPETTASNQTDIEVIKAQFKLLYGGELIDNFVQTMIAKKGLEHLRECLQTYKDYISGRNIKNVAGDFFRFVTDGYQKHTAYKGNIPQRDNFEQREYEDEELEKYYANLTPEKDCSDKSESDNSRTTEVSESHLKSIKQILTPS